jgi:hypothetical protein
MLKLRTSSLTDQSWRSRAHEIVKLVVIGGSTFMTVLVMVRLVMGSSMETRYVTIGALTSLLITLLVVLGSGIQFRDVRWVTLTFVFSLCSKYLSLSEEESLVPSWGVQFGFEMASLVSLGLTGFYFLRTLSMRYWPIAMLLIYVIWMVATWWDHSLSVYALQSMYAIIGTNGAIILWDAYQGGKERKVAKYSVGSLFLVVACLELFVLVHSSQRLSDIMQLVMCWSVGGVVGSELVRTLLRYRRLTDIKDEETSRRIRAEQNIQISLSKQGMDHGSRVKEYLKDIEVSSARAHNVALSGDWMCGLRLSDGSIAVVCGDVYGDGVGASLAASAIVGALGTLDGACESPTQAIACADRCLSQLFSGHVMSSLVLLHFKSDHWCNIYNASHSGVMVYRQDGGMELIRSTCPPAGALEGIKVASVDIFLLPVDVIVLLNSGSSKGARGLRSLARFVETLPADLSCEILSRRLCESLEDHDSQDDHVVICVRKKAA